jgi:F0F1-type ATP synthase membrane subunit b/b'
MIEQAKAAIERKKKCSNGRIETSSFNFIIEHCRKNIERQLSNKAQTKLVEKMLGDVKLN